MMKVLNFIILAFFLSCSLNKNDVKEDEVYFVNLIEKHLSIEQNDDKALLDRLIEIEKVMSDTRKVVYILPQLGVEVNYGSQHKAVVFTKKVNPINNEKAFVKLNDSIIPLDYDSSSARHVLNIKANKIGLNECFGFIVDQHKDTLSFLCDFEVVK